MPAAINSQAKEEVEAAYGMVISVLSLKMKPAAEVTAVSVVEVARVTGVDAQQTSAVATSQVLPSELTHRVTLTTTDYQLSHSLKHINAIPNVFWVQ